MNTALKPTVAKLLYLSLGLIVGILFCFSFAFFVILDKENEKVTESNILALVLTEPLKSLTTNSKTLTISGTTTIASVIIINSPLKNLVLESSDGKFSTKLDLVEGKNTINITAFNKNTGEGQTLLRDVLFLDEDLTNI